MFAIVLFVLSLTVSCSNSEIESKNTAAANETENESEENPVSSETGEDDQHNVFISELVPNKDRSLVDIRDSDFSVQLPFETTFISRSQVFTFDTENNGYTASFNLVNPVTDSISDSFTDYPRFYLIDNKVIFDYSDRITPNMNIPIFKTGSFYVSAYNIRETWGYMIIYSSDLINWHQSGVIHPAAPILLYEQNERFFALAGRQVWDVSDPQHAQLTQELKRTVMPPQLPIRAGSMYVASIKYCFNINNYLVMYIWIAAEEQSGGMYFQTINLNDFSKKSVEVDEALDLNLYEYKALEREDGWKIYHIGRDPADGIVVLDPFTPDGPAIIERLPGVSIP